MIASFRACPLQFKRAYIDCLRPKGEKSFDLVAGAAFAAGLEEARQAYMQGEKPDDALAWGLRAAIQTYGPEDPPERKRNKALDIVLQGLVSYFEEWPLATDPFRIAIIGHSPAIEMSFAVPLPYKHPTTGQPLLYAGRCDWVATQDGGQTLFLVDDKTTGAFRQTWAEDWQLRGQFYGYMWAAYEYGIPVAGTIVRGTCLQLTQIKHLSALVTYEEWKVRRWYTHLCYTIERMLEGWHCNYWEMAMSDACTSYGGCPYARLCGVKKPEPWIDLYYERREWTPLRHAEVEA
jgi:hypothetical protein